MSRGGAYGAKSDTGGILAGSGRAGKRPAAGIFCGDEVAVIEKKGNTLHKAEVFPVFSHCPARCVKSCEKRR